LALQDKLKTAVHFPLYYTSQGSGHINAPHGVRQPQYVLLWLPQVRT